MGHAGNNIVQATRNGNEYEMTADEILQEDYCDTCKTSTQTKYSMKRRLVTDEADIVIHMHIFGPFETKRKAGRKSFTAFIVAKSRYFEVALFRTRD